MQKVLIPTDFSMNAQEAAAYAIAVFGTEAEFTLLNTYEVPHSGATMLISIADILEKDSQQFLSEERRRLQEKFPNHADRIRTESVMGSPESVIRKLTDNGKHDLVVMGTKGASGIKEVLVGSVAANTMQHVKCPVIAVPLKTEIKPPAKILFAADDQWLSQGELPAGLVTLAKRFDSEVMILNVVPKGEISHVGNNPEHEVPPIDTFHGISHSIHFIEDDDVNKGIEAFMNENTVDLLAMVTRKNDLFSRLFGLSNTKSMMMHTDVPLAAFHNEEAPS